MEVVILVAVLLAVIASVLGQMRNESLARRIGTEIRGSVPAEDPVVLLEKLHRLYEAGALTEAEYERQKARLLNQP